MKMRTTRRAATALRSSLVAGFAGSAYLARDVADPAHFVFVTAASFQRIGGGAQRVGVARRERDRSRKLQHTRSAPAPPGCTRAPVSRGITLRIVVRVAGRVKP
ncbi:MAG: hypothetical protein ACT4PJ_05130 [Gemmatimonadaceae bacterium]